MADRANCLGASGRSSSVSQPRYFHRPWVWAPTRRISHKCFHKAKCVKGFFFLNILWNVCTDNHRPGQFPPSLRPHTHTQVQVCMYMHLRLKWALSKIHLISRYSKEQAQNSKLTLAQHVGKHRAMCSFPLLLLWR